MRISLLVGLALLALTSACVAPQQKSVAAAVQSDPRASRRLLVVGGTIRVAAPGWLVARALYAEDGRVIAVGSEADVRAVARAPFTTIELDGAVAVPGLIDAHGHLEGLGESLEEIDLRGVTSYAELIARVAARAKLEPPGTWIEGRGWDQNLWAGQQFPHHAQLSQAVPDHPLLLRRIDGHALLANAKALEIAGLSGVQRDEFPLPGGRMLLDPDQRATGVFVDNDMELVAKHVTAPTPAIRERRVLRAARELLSNGLTGLHDMGESAESARLLEQLSAAGSLKVEVAGYLSQDVLEGDPAKLPLPAPAASAAAPRARATPPTFRVVGAKIYMDGALGSRGAALLADYADEPGNRGFAFLEPERFDALLALCDKYALQPAVHAIGDLGNRRVLDGYQRRMESSAAFKALRPRVEHAQVVAPEDWARFLALGVIPSMQPSHATSDMPWAPARLGAARVQGAYAWRRLDPSGHALAFGSDCPVELCDPLAGLYAAITCADARGEPAEGYRPDQRLDAATALAAFTSNAAHAARQEADFGSLEPGHFANLTVLDVDPLECAPRALLGGGHVRMTIVRGEVAFRAGPRP